MGNEIENKNSRKFFREFFNYKIVRKITLRKGLRRKSQILIDCLFYILFSTALYSKNDATEHIRIAIALE